MGVRSKQVLIAMVIVGISLAYLLFAGIRGNMVFYFTVSEIASQDADLTGQHVRVAGRVVSGSIHPSSDWLEHRFTIQEGGETLEVIYKGITPDTFADDREAVVEGRLGADGVFDATFLMAKCPSKYEAETDYEKFRQTGVAAPATGTP